MPKLTTAADWTATAEQLRQQTLDQVVFRGEAAQWRKQKTKVVWLETVEGGPEYHIRKLRYEAVPGFWIPALLYEPLRLSGKMPAVLNVNGHDSLGKAADYKQIRCINQAKRGMLALNPEWIGMGQLRGTNYSHARMNQLDLCGTAGIAPFYLAMKRGIDVLLEHPNADPGRVAVAGLSGGGWQTIFISSLDTRVKLSNPVAGYSSFLTRIHYFEDLGDSEQTPCDLATVVDYTHLTAMMAPRPTLLTFNAKDNCCFASPHAMEPLIAAAAPAFKLYGKENYLRAHVNYDPGTHNFGLDNRQALYRMFRDHFYPGDENLSATEIPCDKELKTNIVVDVELPWDNADFNSIAFALAKHFPQQPKLPGSKQAAIAWQNKNRDLLRKVAHVKDCTVSEEAAGEDTISSTRARYWRLKIGGDWTVPVTEITRGEPTKTQIVLSDGGRQSAASEIEPRLDAGYRVLAVDPFYFGESKLSSHGYLFALLIAAVGERPVGIQAGQIGAVARWAHRHYGQTPELVAIGPRSSVFCSIAAALETNAISRLELRRSGGSLKEIIETNVPYGEAPELFCFGLLQHFDLLHLAAMVAPRPIVLNEPSERAQAELAPLISWYSLWGAEFRFANGKSLAQSPQ